jgi:N-acetylneuraminic acid mutarotase
MKSTSRMTKEMFTILLGLAVIVFASETFADGTWVTKTPMPTARAMFAAGSINGMVYALGGTGGGCGAYSTMEAYDPATDTWTTKAQMLTARDQMGVGVVNGILYAVGGNLGCGPFINTVEAYDPIADTWTTKAPMPTTRTMLAVGVVDGILYAVGGYNGGYVATMEAYDPATDTWTTKASMPSPRSGLAVGVVDGILYAMGGGDPFVVVAAVEAYNPVTDTWISKAPMPTPRTGLAAVVLNGKIYAVGGSSENIAYAATLESYDPATDTWTTEPSMLTGRQHIAAAAANGVLYAIGGYSDAGYTAENEAFTPITNTYTFSGFFSPVDNPKIVNNAKAGQAIPIKWRIAATNGVPISDPASFKDLASYLINCSDLSGDPASAIEVYAAGSSGLQYSGDGYWQFNWKTPKTYTGQCREIVLTLADGSTHKADFKFK